MESRGVATGNLTKKDEEGICTGQDKPRVMRNALDEMSQSEELSRSVLETRIPTYRV